MLKRKIVKNIFLCVLLGFVLCPFRLLAQDLEVQARPDTDRIRIGEQVKLELSVRFKGTPPRVAFPQLPDSFGHWEVVDRAKIDTAANEQEKHFRQVITLTSFDSGRWELPPLKFETFAADGSRDSAFTSAFSIDVNTVTVDTTKAFKPIKSVRTVPWNIWDYWVYGAIGLGVILLAIGLWWYFRKKPAKAPAPPPVALEAPYDKALRQLNELEQEKLWQQGDVKQYYSRLTDILRGYVEEQFNIAALEQTTAELLQHIKPVTILNQQRDKLRAVLSLADLAKFAKLQPSPDEHEDSLKKAKEIVEWTKPAATPSAAGHTTPNAEGPRR
jgi:hypothetical protein